MTGWKMGYLAAPIDIVKACAKIQSHSTSGPNAISQKAAVAALAMGYHGGPLVLCLINLK